MTRGVSPAKKVSVALRRKNAVKLRAAGLSIPEIAKKLKYTNDKAVRQDITRALKEHGREETGELLELEMMRLDHLQAGLTQAFDGGDRKLADQILRVMTRRAAYVGLDASSREDDYSDVDRWLAGVVDGDEPEIDPEDLLGDELDVEDLEPDELDGD